MFETIIVVASIVSMFILNAEFVFVLDAAYKHPDWGRLDWIKDMVFIFLLAPLSWVELKLGWGMIDTFAIPWPQAPYWALGFSVSLALALCGVGYVFWKRKQPAPVKEDIKLSSMPTCELEHVHGKLNEFMNSLRYVPGSSELYGTLFNLQQQLLDEEMKRVN